MHYSGEVKKTFIRLCRNYIQAVCTKFYLNRLGFVDNVIKHFGVFSVHNFTCRSLTKPEHYV